MIIDNLDNHNTIDQNYKYSQIHPTHNGNT